MVAIRPEEEREPAVLAEDSGGLAVKERGGIKLQHGVPVHTVVVADLGSEEDVSDLDDLICHDAADEGIRLRRALSETFAPDEIPGTQ